MGRKKRIFIAMPFNVEELNSFYFNTLKPLLEELGYICTRADESDDRNLDRPVIEGIFPADIILADISTKNQNVFYELGISHTIPQKTLMITSQERSNLPFDINKFKVIRYDPNKFDKEEFKKELNSLLGTTESNPVTFFKPSEEEPILLNFAVGFLKDSFDESQKLVFIDLDGTLFDSYEHRIRASQKAFSMLFERKTEGELRKLYEHIYNMHEFYLEITGDNFRYNWFSDHIYRISYLQDNNIHPETRYKYLESSFNSIDSKTLELIEKAKKILRKNLFILQNMRNNSFKD